MEEENVRIATDSLALAVKAVADIQAEVNHWVERIQTSEMSDPNLRFYVSERDNANERLKQASERVDKASERLDKANKRFDTDRIIPTLPSFNPSNYEVSFPLLAAKNGEMFLTLLGRDDVVKKINDLVLYVPSYPTVNTPKYSPIIISTSRGMGKTFLLKMIGMQKVKQELENEKIKLARDCGRVLSFDFSENRGIVGRHSCDLCTLLSELIFSYDNLPLNYRKF